MVCPFSSFPEKGGRRPRIEGRSSASRPRTPVSCPSSPSHPCPRRRHGRLCLPRGSSRRGVVGISNPASSRRSSPGAGVSYAPRPFPTPVADNRWAGRRQGVLGLRQRSSCAIAVLWLAAIIVRAVRGAPRLQRHPRGSDGRIRRSEAVRRGRRRDQRHSRKQQLPQLEQHPVQAWCVGKKRGLEELVDECRHDSAGRGGVRAHPRRLRGHALPPRGTRSPRIR